MLVTGLFWGRTGVASRGGTGNSLGYGRGSGLSGSLSGGKCRAAVADVCGRRGNCSNTDYSSWHGVQGGMGGQQHKPCKAEAMCAFGNSRQTTTCQCLLCSSNLPASAATLTDSDVAAAESDTLHLAMLSRASPATQVWLLQVFVLHA